MLRIVSANLNGIRSADKKGFFQWLSTISADFVCVQELKAQAAETQAFAQTPDGLTGYFHYAEKKGYSGVGLYTRHPVDQVITGLGIDWIDQEGRYLQIDQGSLSVISLYLPSGSSSDERQAIKFQFLDVFTPHLQQLLASGRQVVICGDWNIAHQNIDLKNWKGNLKNSGFLPEERDWMSQTLGSGWVDTWRTLYPEIAGYTWWSNRGQAYAKDVGWRIDYQLASPNLQDKLLNASVYKGEKFSDHAPLIVDYALV